MSEYFRINSPDVSREVFADEVIVVDFIGGAYYSLGAVSADIWRSMEQGQSRSEIINSLRRDYSGDPAEIASEASRILDELLQEKLILPSATPPALAREKELVPRAQGEQIPFQTPTLAKFTDMQDLLLLDPIHDVDNTGWPARK